MVVLPTNRNGDLQQVLAVQLRQFPRPIRESKGLGRPRVRCACQGLTELALRSRDKDLHRFIAFQSSTQPKFR